jgi:hypothetical protein
VFTLAAFFSGLKAEAFGLDVAIAIRTSLAGPAGGNPSSNGFCNHVTKGLLGVGGLPSSKVMGARMHLGKRLNLPAISCHK